MNESFARISSPDFFHKTSVDNSGQAANSFQCTHIYDSISFISLSLSASLSDVINDEFRHTRQLSRQQFIAIGIGDKREHYLMLMY